MVIEHLATFSSLPSFMFRLPSPALCRNAVYLHLPGITSNRYRALLFYRLADHFVRHQSILVVRHVLYSILPQCLIASQSHFSLLWLYFQIGHFSCNSKIFAAKISISSTVHCAGRQPFTIKGPKVDSFQANVDPTGSRPSLQRRFLGTKDCNALIATDGLLQRGLCYPQMSFDRFPEPCMKSKILSSLIKLS